MRKGLRQNPGSVLLLVADVGNSSASVALFKNKVLVRRGRISADDLSDKSRAASAAAYLQKTFSKRLTGEADAIIGSVNPPAAAGLERLLKRLLPGTKPLLIGRDVDVPVRNLARKPSEVGADRLLNTLAAFEKTGSQSIVVDYGTCVVFDVVSAKGEFLGGVITPGPRLIASTLAAGTALLPEVHVIRKPPLIGRNTEEAIRSGTFWGIVSAVDGILDQLGRRIGRSHVIATGGHAGLLAPHSPAIECIDRDLTLQGLRLTWQKRFSSDRLPG